MTLLIGANFKQYTIIAADTRASWQGGYNDGDHKIAMWGIGLITGSGYVDALNAVKEELPKRQITQTDQILDVVNQCALPKLNMVRAQNPAWDDNTRFLISYIATPDLALRLKVIYTQKVFGLGLEEDIVVMMPSDSNKVEQDGYKNYLKENLSQNDTQEDFIRNIQLVTFCFSEISQKSAYVSPDLDIAVLSLDGTVRYAHVGTFSGGFEMKVIPPQHKTCYLTPDIPKNL